MRRFTRVLSRNVKLLVSVGAVAGGLGLLLLYRLGSLMNGLSGGEATILHNGISLTAIYHDPLNLPLKLLQWLCFGISGTTSAFWLRLPDVILGALAFVLFGLLLRRWYGVRTALFGSVLFGFSPWFLHASRLAGIDAELLVALPALIFFITYLRRQYDKVWVFYGSAIVMSLLLYVPGVTWLVALGLLLQFRDNVDGWKHFKLWWQRLLYIFTWAAGIWLLVLALVQHTSLWRSWLGLPEHFTAPLTILHHFGEGIIAFLFRAPANPAMWLDKLPILNIFAIAMLFVGVVFYAKHWLAPRSRMLLMFFVISMALYALHGSVTLSLVTPLVYSVAAAGIGYLLHEWLTVFPRNPLARSIGIVAIGLTLSLSCVYNIRHYFVAWPHNPVSRAAFHHYKAS